MDVFAPSPTRLLYTLRRAYLAVEARKEQMLRDLDLLPAHYAVLINVWAHPGATGAELARHLGSTPQNVANLVARLTAKDLLARTPHPRHGHVREVHLTDRGLALLQQADARIAAIEAEVVGALGPDGTTGALHALSAVAQQWNQPIDTASSVDSL